LRIETAEASSGRGFGNERLTALVGRITSTAALLRLRPFDEGTDEGRSKERHRRVVLSGTASVLAKGVSMVAALISVPLTVGYLGAEQYGLWMTVSSLLAMLAFADLGIGNGLLSSIAEASGRDDRDAACRHVSSAFFVLLAIGVVLLVALTIVYPIVSWPKVFNVRSVEAAREAGPAFAVLLVCFALDVPLGIVHRIQWGYQEGFVNNMWQCAASLLGLVGLLTAIFFKAGLPWLVLSMAGAPVVAGLLNGVALFGFRRPWLLPRLRWASSRNAFRILHVGLLFFILQVASSIAFASDNFVAAQVLGPEAVTEYAIPMKLFSFAPSLIIMFLGPLWPAYGEAFARGDNAWVRRTFTRSILVTGTLTFFVSAALVTFARPLLHLWVGSRVHPTTLLLLGLGVWTVLTTVGQTWGVFLYGLHIVGFQVITASLMAIAAFICKIILANHMGTAGVVWGNVLAYTLFTAIPCCVFIPRLLARLEGRH